MKNYIVLLLTTLLAATCFAQSVTGKWKSIDDETGEAKSIVEIYKKGDKVYGKIIEILNEDKKDVICSKCEESDPRYNQKMLGMEIITDMEKDGNEWGEGEILDPNTGKIYDCKLWVEDGKLQVRGYVMFFFRTQTWERM